MYHNVSDAATHLPNFAGDVASGIGKLFSSDDGWKFGLFLAFFALFTLSAVLSFLMVRHFWKKGAYGRQDVIQGYVREHRPARA